MLAKSAREYFVLALRLLLASVLLAAAFTKLRSPESLLVFLAKLQIYEPLNVLLFYGLTSVEMLLGLFCLLGIAPASTLRGVAVLFALFALVVSIALLREISGSCGCFGDVITSDIGMMTVVRNVVLAAIALYASSHRVHRFSLSKGIEAFRASR